VFWAWPRGWGKKARTTGLKRTQVLKKIGRERGTKSKKGSRTVFKTLIVSRGPSAKHVAIQGKGGKGVKTPNAHPWRKGNLLAET